MLVFFRERGVVQAGNNGAAELVSEAYLGPIIPFVEVEKLLRICLRHACLFPRFLDEIVALQRTARIASGPDRFPSATTGMVRSWRKLAQCTARTASGIERFPKSTRCVDRIWQSLHNAQRDWQSDLPVVCTPRAESNVHEGKAPARCLLRPPRLPLSPPHHKPHLPLRPLRPRQPPR